MKQLLDRGIDVQLSHVPKETKWEDVVDHGYIAIKDSAGSELARRDGFQHNRKLRNGGAYDERAVTELVDEVTKLATASSA